jgi:hypothetical protein
MIPEQKNKIEKEYNKLVSWYDSSQKKSNGTGIESVLYFLLENQDKIWWWSWEFIGKTTKNGHYLSHRSPARASDLAKYYSDFVEDRKIGRFKVYRIKIENIEKIKSFLSGGQVEMQNKADEKMTEKSMEKIIRRPVIKQIDGRRVAVFED